MINWKQITYNLQFIQGYTNFNILLDLLPSILWWFIQLSIKNLQNKFLKLCELLKVAKFSLKVKLKINFNHLGGQATGKVVGTLDKREVYSPGSRKVDGWMLGGGGVNWGHQTFED